jgi:uncharacterized iron-regulated membrane protein
VVLLVLPLVGMSGLVLLAVVLLLVVVVAVAAVVLWSLRRCRAMIVAPTMKWSTLTLRGKCGTSSTS